MFSQKSFTSRLSSQAVRVGSLDFEESALKGYHSRGLSASDLLSDFFAKVTFFHRDAHEWLKVVSKRVSHLGCQARRSEWVP